MTATIPETYCLDVETIPGPTPGLTDMRARIFKKYKEEVLLDAEKPKGTRKIINSNLVDPIKIQNEVDQKLEKAGQLVREDDAIDPDCCQIVCAVLTPMSALGPDAYSAPSEELVNNAYNQQLIYRRTEAGVTDFGDMYRTLGDASDAVVGFNSDDFDVPAIRSMQFREFMNVQTIPYLWFRKSPYYDVFKLLTNGRGVSWKHAKSLREYVAIYLGHLNINLVQVFLCDEFTGADVLPAWNSGDRQRVIDHCRYDSLMTALLARYLRVGV